jgi:hypothetical protein
MTYRTTLAVIEGGNQGRRERRDDDTRWGNLLIGERISWSDERSKQGWLHGRGIAGVAGMSTQSGTLQTGITDPGKFSISPRDAETRP